MNCTGEPDQLTVEYLPAWRNAHATVLGELQRIAYQIEQNLADPRRVASDLQLLHAGRQLQL
ncbi:hypothetical protein D3C85_1787380 [compost metagenome]